MSSSIKARLALLFGLVTLALGLNFFLLRRKSLPTSSQTALRPGEDTVTASRIQFLEARVRHAPDDHVAQNMLAGSYLRRARQTGDPEDVALAFRATHASLDSVPPVRNTGGLALLAQEEYTTHAFADARDHALQWIAFEPNESGPYQILGDALLELGQYSKAAAAYRTMQKRGDGVEVETRLARLALLRGDPASATRRFFKALTQTLSLNPPPPETVAWCRWQLGEVAFASGDYTAAERYYRTALASFPDYTPARASLGRILAARGDRAGAITQYERAVQRLPNLVFRAALGDLYRLSSSKKQAQAQYALVLPNGQKGDSMNARPDRQLALFYADHDLRAQEAYTIAARSYQERADIYGADILAWTALKAGKIQQARSAIQAALRLGTRDARLYYHAGLIAQAAGNTESAREYLSRALALNPQFDPLQAPKARNALHKIETVLMQSGAAGRDGKALWLRRKPNTERAAHSDKTNLPESKRA